MDDRLTTEALRARIRQKYSDVAAEPERDAFFHTGRAHAIRIGYDKRAIASLPETAVQSFCGVANPFELRRLTQGELVVDVGCGTGLDCLVAAGMVGSAGQIVGVDMTEAMLAKARTVADQLGVVQATFRCGVAEDLPVESRWATAVISNGVFNLCPDKLAVLREAWRCLRPGGYLQFADVSFPAPTRRNADKQGFMSIEGWVELLAEAGFVGIAVGRAVDTFAGAPEPKGTFRVFGYPLLARRPVESDC